MCATRLRSPSCGRPFWRGSMVPRSLPPTTRHSNRASCAPAAPDTGYGRHAFALPARCNLLAVNGQSVPRRCPMSVGVSAFLIFITTLNPTRWRVRKSCWRRRPRAGNVGGVASVGTLPAAERSVALPHTGWSTDYLDRAAVMPLPRPCGAFQFIPAAILERLPPTNRARHPTSCSDRPAGPNIRRPSTALDLAARKPHEVVLPNTGSSNPSRPAKTTLNTLSAPYRPNRYV